MRLRHTRVRVVTAANKKRAAMTRARVTERACAHAPPRSAVAAYE
jgi:hypothetical protein